MADVWFTRGLHRMLSGQFNPASVTVKAMLTTAAYAESKASHSFRSQVTNEVAAGAGYATGGVNVTAVVAFDEANSRVDVSLGQASWTVPAGQTLTARKCVYYVSLGSATTDWLIGVNDFDADVSATNQPLNVPAITFRINN